jgi:hypothetical protein
LCAESSFLRNKSSRLEPDDRRADIVLNHSDFELFTPVLNNDLIVVLLDDASASPASNDFDLVAQSSA